MMFPSSNRLVRTRMLGGVGGEGKNLPGYPITCGPVWELPEFRRMDQTEDG